jgi:type I restriction enzyme S subunit
VTWLETTLGNSCELYQPQTITTKDLIDDGKYLVYGANGVIGRYDKFNHAESQLLVTCRGATCGAVNISSPYAWINGNAMVVKPKHNNIDIRFIEYFFRGAVDLSKAITGAAQPQITRQSLSPIKFHYPPLATQKKIVAKLDAIFAEIDKAKAAAEANAKNAETLFQSYLTELFEKLTNENKSVNLKNICKFENGDRGKNYPSKQHQVESGIPFINAGDLKEGWSISRSGMAFITEERFNLLGAGKVKLGDLLFCLRGSLGKCGIVEDIEVGAIASSLVIIRPLPNLSISKFVYWFLSSSICAGYIDETKGGAAQPNLSAKSVMNFQIPMINTVSQVEIVKPIDSFYSYTLKIKESYIQKIKELNLLKQAILKQAFNGELVKE